jgi:carbon starvation protein
MVFVTSMALLSALYQVRFFFMTGQYLLFVMDILILIGAIFVMLEAATAIQQARQAAVEPA